MPVTLVRTISKIQSIPNQTNARLVEEMYKFMKSNGVSERHQHNALKVMITFANYLGRLWQHWGSTRSGTVALGDG
jgi:hypothetical protein